MKTILVTGAAGYIGSHTCVVLLENGYNVIAVDNLCNSEQESLKRVEKITGKFIPFYQANINDNKALEKPFTDQKIDAVIHFAGLKAVGESCELPLHYYENNVSGTVSLCRTMEKHGVYNIVFSSSATVYGLPHQVPIDESFPTSATNPYGRSKLITEEILQDLSKSSEQWKISLLRYFNPIGAHSSGLIGEDPKGTPNNLLPYITQVAIGKLEKLSIFGDDYPTTDGTGVRDYIHVCDLARGHLKALDFLNKSPSGCFCHNLGTGKGYSVLEMITAFEKASKTSVPFNVVSRRPGDIAECYADTTKAKIDLLWEAEYDLNTMMEDSWRWQKSNPKGYSV